MTSRSQRGRWTWQRWRGAYGATAVCLCVSLLGLVFLWHRSNSELPRGRFVLVNFADGNFKGAQRGNCQSGIKSGGFTECHATNRSYIDPFFSRLNSDILSVPVGAGLWLWKPYVILRTLTEETDSGDVVFYSDAAAYFYHSAEGLRRLAEEHDIVLFEFNGRKENGNGGDDGTATAATKGGFLNGEYAKRDTFELVLGANESEIERCAKEPSINSAFIVVRNSFKARLFISHWLALAQDRRALSDDGNVLGKPNFPEFQKHRHDQAILSLLACRWGSAIHRLPDRDIPKYLHHHRSRF